MKTRPDPYQSIVKKIHSNDNNYNSHHHGGGISSMSSDRANPTAAIMHLRKGLSLYDAQEEFSASSLSSSSSLASSSPSVFESNWKISEIVNPDGSKTVRRKVLSKDGQSYNIVEEQVIKSPEHTSFSSSVSSLSPGFPPPTTSKLQLQTKYWYHYRMRNGQSFTESRSLAPDAFGTDPFQVVKPAATAATAAAAAAAALSQESAMSSLSSSSPHATKPLHQDTNDSFSGIESVLDGQDSILDGEAPPKSQRAPVAPGEEQQQQRVGNSARKKPVTPKSKVQSVFVSPQLQTNTNKNKHVVTVVKKEMGESLGISVGVRDFLDGPPRLVVSKIGRTSKLRLTPLAAGDVVESINDISFIVDDPNPEAAFEIVRNSKTITFVVRKPQPIKQHPKPHAKQKKVTLTDIPDLSTMQNEKSESNRDHEFDEDSYDASLNGYQSCKIVQFPKLDPQEDVGLTLESKHTKWGRLLLVSEISPFSKLHYSGLQVGDAVLEINSFCFRETPDADIANGLLKEAWGDVVIEYQPLSHMTTTTTNSPTTPSSSSSKEKQQPAPAEPQPESRITESVKFDGARCIRTEQVNPDGSTSIKIEELPPSALRNKDKTKKSTTVTMEQPSQFIPEINPHHNHHSNVATIMVRKQSPSDDVGIILAKAKDEGFLFVTKVSPTGLLAGKPVLPGDKILSINDKDFRSHRNKPSVQDAYAEIRNAPSTVTFKLAKRSTPKKTKKSNSSSKKQQQEQRRKREIEEQHKTKFCERFSCSGRRKQVESKRSDRSLSSSSSSYASASTKGKTSEYQNALYI